MLVQGGVPEPPGFNTESRSASQLPLCAADTHDWRGQEMLPLRDVPRFAISLYLPFFFLSFLATSHIRSSWARDQIQAAVVTYTATVATPDP